MNQSEKQFALEAGEEILYETKWGSWLKSTVQVTAGRVILTTRRLVFCDTGYTGFGIIFLIVQFFMPATRVVWEVPVNDIATVVRERHGLASKYVVTCGSGQKYTIQVGTGDAKWKECVVKQGIRLNG